jgi:hypothetical protein
MPSRQAKPRKYKPRVDRKNTEAAQAHAAALLAIGQTKGQIKIALSKRFRGMSPRTAEDVITAARELLRDATGLTEDEHRNNAYRVYMEFVSNTRLGGWMRLKAQERIDKLLALEGPVKVDVSGGVAFTARVAAEVLAQGDGFRAALDALDEQFAKRRTAAPPTQPPAPPAQDEVPDDARDDARPGDATDNGGDSANADTTGTTGGG